MKRITCLILFVTSSYCSSGQNGLDPGIMAIDNYSIMRTGHKDVGFTVNESVLKEIKRHRKKYKSYFFNALSDTSKTIVAHLILLKLTGESISVGECVYIDSAAEQYGFTYSLNGLSFRKYINGKYYVDPIAVDPIRNKWIEVLSEQ